MCSKIYSPNILATRSFQLAESSYSVRHVSLSMPVTVCSSLHIVFQCENGNDIGVAAIDSFTQHILQFVVGGINMLSRAPMQDLRGSPRSASAQSSRILAFARSRYLDFVEITGCLGGVAPAGTLPEGDDVE